MRFRIRWNGQEITVDADDKAAAMALGMEKIVNFLPLPSSGEAVLISGTIANCDENMPWDQEEENFTISLEPKIFADGEEIFVKSSAENVQLKAQIKAVEQVYRRLVAGESSPLHAVVQEILRDAFKDIDWTVKADAPE